MSHVADVECAATDLDDVDAALRQLEQEFGIRAELRRGQTTWKWFNNWLNDWNNPERAAALRGWDPAQFGHGEHAIVLTDPRYADAYEIGLVPRRDGQPGWELLYDAWGGKLERIFGVGLAKLAAEIGSQAMQHELAAQGLEYTVTRDENQMPVVEGWWRD